MPKAVYIKAGRFRPLLMGLALQLAFSSCYSVRIINRDGVPEPDPTNNATDFYRGKKVNVISKTVSLKLLEGEFHLVEKCASGAFYSFEYRSTFGGVLMSALTFGKKRQVRVKYICSKQSN